jgi:hypothetical protein
MNIPMTSKNAKITSDGVSSYLPLFSPEECIQITDWAIRHGSSQYGLVHAHQQASRASLRRCKEYLIEPTSIAFSDGSSVASRVYEAFGLGNIWELEFSEVPSIRIMEYQVRDGYGRHTDWSNGAAKHRKISMTCQLSSPKNYDGGAVTLYAGPESQDISRQQGAATLWPSWTLHEVQPITRGVRYSLTAWAHGTPYR